MKYTGIAGLLAVVTAVTGAAIPNVQLSQATDAEIAKLQKDLTQVQKALDHATQKRGILSEATGSAPLVGDVTKDADAVAQKGPLSSVTGAIIKRDGLGTAVDAASGAVGTAGDATKYALGTVGQAITKRGDLVNTLDQGVQGIPLLGGPASEVVGTAEGALKPVLGALKREDPLNTVDQTVQGVPLVGGPASKVVGAADDALKPVLGAIKREDPVSQLASQLLPQLQSLNVLPQGVGLEQLTGLLNELNVQGLVGNLEQVLGSLTNGGLLSGLTSLLKRDDQISQLANKLLPGLLQKNILSNVGVGQLTTLLNTLNVNGLLTNVESVVSGVL